MKRIGARNSFGLAMSLAILATNATLLALAGCGSSEIHGSSAEPVGDVDMQLTLPDGSRISQADYTISGNGITPITGTVNVNNSPAISFQLGGIPSGTNYTVALTATTSDGETCTGSTTFSVAAGAITAATVPLSCGTASTTGGVRVGTEINRCAIVTSLSALPLSAEVGSTISLSATASAAGATFAWSATSGSFATPAAASTTYSCPSAGSHTITVSVTGGGSACTTADTDTVTVECVASADAGAP
jgi:hypothetical protein